MSKQMTIEEFEDIKEQVEQRRSQVEQKKGELKAIEKTLKEEFGCDSIEDAEKLLADLKEEQEQLEEKLAAKTSELQELWEEQDDE